jgi:hypothetical protein
LVLEKWRFDQLGRVHLRKIFSTPQLIKHLGYCAGDLFRRASFRLNGISYGRSIGGDREPSFFSMWVHNRDSSFNGVGDPQPDILLAQKPADAVRQPPGAIEIDRYTINLGARLSGPFVGFSSPNIEARLRSQSHDSHIQERGESGRNGGIQGPEQFIGRVRNLNPCSLGTLAEQLASNRGPISGILEG